MSRLNSFRGSRSLLLPQLPLTYARRQRQLLSHVKYLKKERSFGALMVLLPDYLAKAITDWTTENIPDFHLAKGGRETRPHVTVRYGFPDSGEETVQELRSYLQGTSPARITLKSLSTFPEGDDGVPLIVMVESPELERLNAELGMMYDCEDTHPKYVAHVTLAYLRPEVAESYLKSKPPFLPTTTTVDRLEWSGADARTELIELSILPQFGVKAMPDWYVKGIVERPDKLGRRNCYDDQTGKRVPCPKKEGGVKPRQKKPAKPKVGEVPTEKVQAPKPEPPQTDSYERYALEEIREEREKNDARRRDVKQDLSKGKIVEIEPLGGGANRSFVVAMESGRKGVFKPKLGEKGNLRRSIPDGTYYLREAAASDVAEILGMDDLVPSTTTRSTALGVGSVQEFVPGAVDAFSVDGVRKYGGDEVWMRSAVFDLVVGNTDRHEGNWLITKDGKIVLIDNGLSFPEKVDRLDAFGYWSDPELTNALEISDDVREWSSKGKEIAEALVRSGLSEAAVKLTLDRLSRLKGCKTVGDYMKKLGPLGW